MAQQGPRTEFSQALKAVASERGLDVDVIIETIKQAIIAAYKRDEKERTGVEPEGLEYDVVIDPVGGDTKIYSFELETPDKKEDVTPPGFGRIAAQTAKQVIHQKIREAEKGAIMDEFSGRVGGLISGVVLRFDGPNVRVDLGRTEALMPSPERIPSERLNPGQRLTFLLKEIEDTPRGKQIILSRADPEFVKKVFTREVPEISSGSVEIRAISREPGVRTKVAVASSQTGVDPVGSCVGQKGVRVQTVTNELGGERVDIIPWTDDEEEFLKATLAPVEVKSLRIDRDARVAYLVVPDDQLSLAIGKDGQNVRLAAQLTGWKIEIEGDNSAPAARVEEPVEEVQEPEKTEVVEEAAAPEENTAEETAEAQEVEEEAAEVNAEEVEVTKEPETEEITK